MFLSGNAKFWTAASCPILNLLQSGKFTGIFPICGQRSRYIKFDRSKVPLEMNITLENHHVSLAAKSSKWIGHLLHSINHSDFFYPIFRSFSGNFRTLKWTYCTLLHYTAPSGWWFQPLWKIWVRQLGWWHSQYDGKVIKTMFQTTNQLYKAQVFSGSLKFRLGIWDKAWRLCNPVLQREWTMLLGLTQNEGCRSNTFMKG